MFRKRFQLIYCPRCGEKNTKSPVWPPRLDAYWFVCKKCRKDMMSNKPPPGLEWYKNR